MRSVPYPKIKTNRIIIVSIHADRRVCRLALHGTLVNITAAYRYLAVIRGSFDI